MSNPLKEKILHYINDNLIYKGMFQLPHKYLTEVKALLSPFSMYAITTEGGDGTESDQHMHYFIVVSDDFKVNTFKKKIRSKFPQLKRDGKGGEHKYACVLPTIKNAKQYHNFISAQDQLFLQICYIFKDCILDPISGLISDCVLYNLTKDDALYLKSEYFKIKETNIDLKIKHQSKTNNERQTVVKLLLDQIKAKYSDVDATGQQYFNAPPVETVIDHVCQYFIKLHKTLNKNTIQNIVESIMCINNEKFYNNYVNDLKIKIEL